MICAICVQAEHRNPAEKAIKITNYDRYLIQLSRTVKTLSRTKVNIGSVESIFIVFIELRHFDEVW